MEPKQWWVQGQSYQIGDSPSQYVINQGTEFIGKHLGAAGDMLADFGTWTGRNLPALTGFGKPVVATDTSQAREALQMARHRFPDVKFIETPLFSLPFANQSVGGAICWRVLHNITDTDEMISSLLEINRVLKPNAPLLIAVRSEKSRQVWKRIFSYIRRRPNGAGGWREDVYFTNDSLKLLATLVGFTVELITIVNETEVVANQKIKNNYLVAHLIKKNQPLDNAWKNLVKKLIVRPPKG